MSRVECDGICCVRRLNSNVYRAYLRVSISEQTSVPALFRASTALFHQRYWSISILRFPNYTVKCFKLSFPFGKVTEHSISAEFSVFI